MTEGRLSHLLMQARELMTGRDEMTEARHLLTEAIQIVRAVHRDRPPRH